MKTAMKSKGVSGKNGSEKGLSHKKKMESAKNAILATIKSQTEEGNLDLDTANDLEFIIGEFLDKITPSGKSAYAPVDLFVEDDDDFAPYNDMY